MSDRDQARKFLFDLSFDGGANKTSVVREEPKPKYTEDDMLIIKQQAFEEGKKVGAREAEQSKQQKTNELLGVIGSHLSSAMNFGDKIWQRQLAQLQEIALVIARKVIPSYSKTHGLAEIEAVVRRVMAEMGREPRLVFRLHPDRFEEASTMITDIARSAAYAGKIVTLEDRDIGPSDCRVEWADGGIERDLRGLWEEIDRIMESVQSVEYAALKENDKEGPEPQALTASLDPATSPAEAKPASFAPLPPSGE